MTVLRWGSATDVGMVREVNQDSMLISEPLFAVADGMGGHQGGEVASASALEILEASFAKSTSKDELLEAVRRANAKVWDKAQLDDALHGMGTTLTAVALVINEDNSESLAVINVGDSRTYLLRDGELSQITTDHSFVEEMVRAGEITPEEAETHPKRNILTRALGVEPTVEVDIELLRPQPGDRVLLCSDGLVREISDNQIAGTLRRLDDPDEAAKDLVSQAKVAGGHDNITVVIVDVNSDTDNERPITINTPVRNREARQRLSTPIGGRLTFRVIMFGLGIVVLLAIAAGSILWYARASYYVGLEGQQITIYQGRPDKFLWFTPTIAERTNVLTSEILPSAIPNLQAGATQASLSAAQEYVRNLKSEGAEAKTTPGSEVPASNATTTTATSVIPAAGPTIASTSVP